LLWSSVFIITVEFPLSAFFIMALLLLSFSLIHKIVLFSGLHYGLCVYNRHIKN
jgi:hypothetical protein